MLHDNSRAFARLCTAGLLAYGSYAMCRSPLLPLLARELGAGPPMVGLVVAASTLTGVFVKLPAGTWSDVVGRVPLLLAAAVIFAVMPFSYLPIASLGALIAIRVVHGTATAIMGPVMSATISDIAPLNRRATWLSFYSTTQGVGQALGPIVAGFLIGSGRYDLLFLLAGAVALATPVLVASPSVRAAAAPRTPGRHRQQLRQGVLEVIAERRILVASVAHAFYFIINGTLNAFLPLYAHDRIGLTAGEIGWLFGMQTITTLAIRPVIGAASDRLGRRGAIALGLSGCAASVLGISLASSTTPLYGAALAYAISVAITTAATSAYITDVAPKARFGAAHGVFGTIYDVGDAAGPLVGGVLVAAWGYVPTFQLMAALAAITAAAFVVWSRD
ncbi:MAG TPA: MFS transporter [Vicinamibacterales bacterium]|nr:MFS transporter [Vicinamibacterales bacterium]